jgi:hypothetical protein
MKKIYKEKYLEYQSKGYCIIENCFDETILENSFN